MTFRARIVHFPEALQPSARRGWPKHRAPAPWFVKPNAAQILGKGRYWWRQDAIKRETPLFGAAAESPEQPPAVDPLMAAGNISTTGERAVVSDRRGKGKMTSDATGAAFDEGR